jgi:citrate synthase
LPEGLFYLMLLDEMPTPEDVEHLSKDWAKRQNFLIRV